MINKLLIYILRPFHFLFYKSIIVKGKKLIPKNQPVIFVSNHHNSMMDVLAILETSGKNPYTFAQQPFFKKAKFKVLLKALRIIPNFWSAKPENKQKDLKKGVNLLKKKKSLLFFPEVGKPDFYRLLALKKDFLKVGFDYLKSTKFEEEVWIVPVGIFYTKPTRFKSSLRVSYGNPISLKNYKKFYQQNPGKCTHVLKIKVVKELFRLIINIKNQDYQPTFIRLIDFYASNLTSKLKPQNDKEITLFKAKQNIIYFFNEIIESEPETFAQLRIDLDDYYYDVKRLNMSNKQIERHHEKKRESKSQRIFLLFISIPFAIVGFLVSYIPLEITKSMLKKSEKEELSTYKFLSAISIFPLFHIILSVALGLIFSNIYFFVGGMVLTPICSYIFYQSRKRYKALRNYFKLENALKKRKGEMYEMMRKRKELTKKINFLFETHYKE